MNTNNEAMRTREAETGVPEYEKPLVIDYGSLTELTQGSKSHPRADQLVGAPIPAFSANHY